MAACHDDHRCFWRTRAEELATELKATRAELDTTRAELASTRVELSQTRTELDATRRELDATRRELDATRRELDATRTELGALRDQTAVLAEQFAVLQQRVFGRSSERQRITPVATDVRRRRPADPAEKQRKRRATEERKRRIPSVQIKSPPADSACHCPHCQDGPEDFTEIGRKQSVVFSRPPTRLIRKVYIRITRACHCGKTVVTGPPPRRFADKSAFDTSVVASLVVGKCADSTPVARQAEQLRREGLPASRATLNRLFLRAGSLLTPLAQLILARIAQREIVLGDETPMRQQDQSGKGYFWTFNDDELVAYVYSPSRSGETPRRVLGGTQGELVVDGYTGYNPVTQPDGRHRVGCNSHARRRFCEARLKTPEAQQAIDLYTEVFLVEHEAEDLGILGTPEHLQLRQQRSAPAMQQLHDWCLEQQPLHLPKGKMGEAIRYLLNNWQALTRFLENPKIPATNNRSERLLRVVAQGRKNYLTIGHTFAGECIAALYTLTACCKVAEVDPVAYFTDVLDRINDHPQHRIDELLPQNWKPPDASDPVLAGTAPG